MLAGLGDVVAHGEVGRLESTLTREPWDTRTDSERVDAAAARRRPRTDASPIAWACCS